jgi:hypothetical protein
MVLEYLSHPDVSPQRVHRLVSADIHHLENRSAVGRRRRQEARSKRVARERAAVESFALRIGLDDIGDGSVREPLRCHRAGLVDGTE